MFVTRSPQDASMESASLTLRILYLTSEKHQNTPGSQTVPLQLLAFYLFQALAHVYFNIFHCLLLSQSKKLSQALIPALCVKHQRLNLSVLISCSHAK